MIPHEFLERMKKILGEEYGAFEAALSENAERGFRINPLKYDGDFCEAVNYDAEPLSYVKGGFRLLSDARGIGNTGAHHSGKIYIQDPGAMASAECVEVKEGMWIADLCAAPGGKSTQLAAKLGGTGFILSNEYVPKRAKILVGNFERMGITNGMVTSLDTSELKKLFRAVFDIVVCDAPCSGEGMLRKDVPAAEEWSLENIAKCKARQLDILDNASHLVKSGGSLLYSTCTYSPEENEEVVVEFIRSHPNFRLKSTPDAIIKASCGGLNIAGGEEIDLSLTRRFYPHKSKGEGQFVAVFERTDDAEAQILYKDSSSLPSRDEIKIIEDFFRENLTQRPCGEIRKHANNPVLVSHGCPVLPRSVFSAGVLIGEIKGKILVPSHQFFSCYGRLFKNRINLESEEEASLYLSGGQLDTADDMKGFTAILYKGSPLGGGKASCAKVNNHYPKGLRIQNI